MVENSDLSAWDESELQIQDQLPGSIPTQSNVPDLNSSNYSINLPEVWAAEVCPRSLTSTNGIGKYII